MNSFDFAVSCLSREIWATEIVREYHKLSWQMTLIKATICIGIGMLLNTAMYATWRYYL